MADSTTNLDTISSSQSGKEITANGLFDAMSANALFGRRGTTTSGLTWGYYGGKFQKPDGTLVAVANGTVALTASATNYLYADATGAVQKVTAAPAGWPAPLASDAIALYEIVADASGVTSYTDWRAPMRGPAGAEGPAGPAGPEGPEGPPGPSGVDLLTTKGDLLTHDGSDAVRLPVGTTGKMLRANPGASHGLQWYDVPFDVHVFHPGVPGASAVLIRVPFAREVTFPNDFSGSYAKGSAASTGTVTFDIQKNGASIGSITFTASATGVLTTTGTTETFAAGDVLSIVGPGSPDPTLANIGIVLAGVRGL